MVCDSYCEKLIASCPNGTPITCKEPLQCIDGLIHCAKLPVDCAGQTLFCNASTVKCNEFYPDCQDFSVTCEGVNPCIFTINNESKINSSATSCRFTLDS